MWIPKATLPYILSEKLNLLSPVLRWAALNIISSECADLLTGVSQALLISKPTCITVNISFCYLHARSKWRMLPCSLMIQKRLSLGSRITDCFTKCLFFRCCVFTHSITWRAWVRYCHSLHAPHSPPLAASETRGCAVGRRGQRELLGVGSQHGSAASARSSNQKTRQSTVPRIAQLWHRNKDL